MTSRPAALDLPFVGFATTLNHQFQRRNIDLCGCYQHSNYFAILVPEWVYFQKFATEANDYQNIVIIISIIIIIIIIITIIIL